MPLTFLDRYDRIGIMNFARFCQENTFSPVLKGIRLSILGMYGDEEAEDEARKCLKDSAYKCCLLSMPAIPTDFDQLRLSTDYHSYYVQAANDKTALYYIDMKHHSIARLPIKVTPSNNQVAVDQNLAAIPT